MKKKIPEEVLNEIEQAIIETAKTKEIFDNLQISIQDTTETELTETKTLKEYLKERLIEKYGRYTSTEFGTVIEIIIKKETINVKLVNDAIYICGRYRKNIRGISNTPMVFGETMPSRRRQKQMKKDAKIMESCKAMQKEQKNAVGEEKSVKETRGESGLLLNSKEQLGRSHLADRMLAVSDWVEPLKEYFEGNKAVFISGGREDYDVRMLGNGRPFICRIENPCRNLPRKVGLLCNVISESGASVEEYTVEYKPIDIEYNMSKDVEILDTLLVDGAVAMKDLKKIEEEHSKVYSVKVLCNVPKKILINRLISTYWKEEADNAHSGMNSVFSLMEPDLKLNQRTPIRVLHRRANLVRNKIIHSCRIVIENTQEDQNTMLQIEIKSSSGTYIKEFVNGDMGRTSPSLSEVVGEYCAVLELDVLSTEDTFPDKKYVLAPVNLV
ncbi:tRNA pseudouridine synthase 10 [Nematocida sp. ERTm5]|nr:tRNA pseudouridine synthase 10 [Nematocida sp. ERTm5]